MPERPGTPEAGDVVRDPRNIRAYEGIDGRYLHSDDLAAWLRYLGEVSRRDPVSSVMHAPLLDRIADAVGGMGDAETGPVQSDDEWTPDA